MIKYLILLICFTSLCSCNSTPHSVSSSQSNSTKLLILEQRAESGDENAKYSLALQYAKEKSTVPKAMNLLRTLADDGHKEGTYMLVLYQMLGYEGEFKDDELYKYAPPIGESHPELKSIFEKFDGLRKNYNNNKLFWNDWYAQAYLYCKSWDSSLNAPIPNTLSARYAHIAINHVESCIESSTVQDIRMKWLLVSQAQQNRCDEGLDKNEQCLSEVTRIIGGIDTPDLNNTEKASWLVVGLNRLIKSNKQSLLRDDPITKIASERVGKMLSKALENYNADRQFEGIRVIENYLEQNKSGSSSDFDLAYTHSFLGRLYGALNIVEEAEKTKLSWSERIDKSIKFLSMSIEPEILNAKEHHGNLELLSNLYLEQESYKAAFKMQLMFLKYSKAEDKIYDSPVLQAQLKMVEQSLENDKAGLSE